MVRLPLPLVEGGPAPDRPDRDLLVRGNAKLGDDTLLGAAVTAVMIPAAGPWAAMPGALTVLVGVVFLCAGLHGRFIARRLRGFRDGDYLVHWTCTREEWDGYLDARLQEDNQRSGSMAWLTVLAGAAAGIGSGLGAAETAAGDVAATALTVGFWAFLGAAVGGAVGWLLMCQLRRRADAAARRQREELVGEAYVGINSVYCDGRCLTWFGAFTTLQCLERVPGKPEVLRFTFCTSSGRSRVASAFLVPIPAGRTEEAEEVVRLYNGKHSSPEVPPLLMECEKRLAGNR